MSHVAEPQTSREAGSSQSDDQNAGSSPLRLAFALAVGYLAGTIPSADIASGLARRFQSRDVDLRAVGSGNPGAANAMANLGAGWGVAVLAGDILKGVAAAFGGRVLAGGAGGYAASTGAVAGHCFPVWNGFRGGKGVATSLGTTVGVFPAYIPVDAGVVAVSWVASRHAGKASTAASGIFVIGSLLWSWRQWPNLWGPRPSRGLPLYALCTSAMIAYKFATAPAHFGNVSSSPAGTAAADDSHA